jgi:hypothetical protein
MPVDPYANRTAHGSNDAGPNKTNKKRAQPVTAQGPERACGAAREYKTREIQAPQ